MRKYRHRIFEIISIGNQKDTISRAFDYCLVAAILLNITVLFLETFDSLAEYMWLFETIESVTVLFFAVEYALRIYTAPELYDELPPMKARLRFLVSFDGIVDLMTILPFFFLYGFAVFRILRVVRIFHLFRLNTNYDSFNVITSVIYRKRNQLFSSIFILLILLFASSLCMYSAEHEAQPELFQNAFSGIWYSLNTIFTVGYGDIYPITQVGRFMGAVITFLGVGAVAIPTGIISAGFVEEYQRMAERETSVPNRQKPGKRFPSDASANEA
ncbi:MAG: ion transporter, partial [bacterium]